MRNVIWILLLAGVAVVAAAALGTNDGLVTFYWRGWRADVSLNLFLGLLIGTCFVLVTAIQTAHSLIGLPQRARQWRVARRDRNAQASFRDALAQYFGGRYSRAQKSAERALTIQSDTPELAQDNEFTVLSHLLAAGSAHRLQDRAGRDHQLKRALDLSRRSASARSAEEGARLLAAEWAIDDRDAPRAMELLSELPQGVARRTHALRLRLQATRLGRQPQEALKTARLLAKHQGFSKVAALGLLRSLAFESLDTAHDADQLRRVWLQFEGVDRRDAFVAARAAERAVLLGVFDDARAWLRPFWDRLPELAVDERVAVAVALAGAVDGIGPEWLPRLEATAQAFPREGAVALAVGSVLAERQLWGKARSLMEQAAADVSLGPAPRRAALRALAAMAKRDGEDARAAQYFEAAARLD
ncbi:MAG: heme biosynthesis protein HemY [Rhizobacter sp.]|nr:heme biosynthesis protein HemY [Rhizobacter sp.]